MADDAENIQNEDNAADSNAPSVHPSQSNVRKESHVEFTIPDVEDEVIGSRVSVAAPIIPDNVDNTDGQEPQDAGSKQSVKPTSSNTTATEEEIEDELVEESNLALTNPRVSIERVVHDGDIDEIPEDIDLEDEEADKGEDEDELVEEMSCEGEGSEEECEVEEEEGENEEDEELVMLRAQEEEALYDKKMKLIDGYINAKADYRYLMKKNAYLQDKLYKICVRKGFIVENVGGENEEKGKKKKKKISLDSRKNNEDEGGDEVAEDEQDGLGEATSDLNDSGGERSVGSNGAAGGGFKSFLEAAMESKYQKIIWRIWNSEQSKTNDAMTHELNLSKIQEKREKWEKVHQEKFLDLMDRVKQASEAAIDSNSGRHILGWETEQFLEEMTKIHAKLCQTMVKMYQNRHGLEFALKSLEETEVQGEGLQMLEYEQLQAENYSLKEKLEDRQRDVENIKAKIAHAVQILAHFRECMSNLQDKMDDGNAKLSIINKRVYQVREVTDVVTQRYEVYRDEEKNLIAESGLLDNTKLLRDFEKTHYDVSDLKEEKRKLVKKLLTKSRELEELQAKIRDVQLHFDDLQKMAQERAGKGNHIRKHSKESEVLIEPREQKKEKLKRLHWLLESRNLDPSSNARPSTHVTKFPAIGQRYHCNVST